MLEPHFLSFCSVFQFSLQGMTATRPPLHAAAATARVSAVGTPPLDTPQAPPVPLVSLRSARHDGRVSEPFSPQTPRCFPPRLESKSKSSDGVESQRGPGLLGEARADFPTSNSGPHRRRLRRLHFSGWQESPRGVSHPDSPLVYHLFSPSLEHMGTETSLNDYLSSLFLRAAARQG